MFTSRFLILILTTFACWSCTLNTAPEITKLTAAPNPVYTDEKTILTCEAEASYGQLLDYMWYADYGTLPDIKIDPSLTWIAPSDPGSYEITVEVTDGIYRYDAYKNKGFSVRCIKDD